MSNRIDLENRVAVVAGAARGMKRFAAPSEIAALVVWLCSEDCSYTTGATFDAAGGRTNY